MFENPFTPLFGGKPDCFFGRERILERFEMAMVDKGSDDRALFITGSRGYGKTALLEQLSLRAKTQGRTVIDVGSDNPLGGIMRHLAPFDETTRTIDPEVDVSVLGTGGKLRMGARSKTAHYHRDDFEFLFLKAFEDRELKLFLTIDEIQKVDLDDIALICEAFQMASRKGHDVMIAVAGLPYAHDRVITHDGCTFMRRAPHEQLGPLRPEEVLEAFASSLESIKGLSASSSALEALTAQSKGHPYIMQLQGYYLVEELNRRSVGKRHSVTEEDIERSMPHVIRAYQRRALDPLVSEMNEGEVEYLRAMASLLDSERIARTRDIADALGREPKHLSNVRERLINNGIIIAPSRGYLAFLIPYLADYLLDGTSDAVLDVDNVLQWRM